MITSQGLFLVAAVVLSLANSNTVALFGLTLICAGFSVGFGVAMSQALGPFSLLGIAQVCGSSFWIWLAAIIGIDALNMLIAILIVCSIVSLSLIMLVTLKSPVPNHEEIHQQSRS